ncbi:MAG: tRNA (adenosine(37)-N6)-threonylcarbamoyltransferase complex ATPase subunit type 1 TsaE [Victivallales bacterium]|nr:tRNA (adenosine(37)-N6)-threonylcarbamoyltransferase complex ATPase subunit type 1 TsaE [Victivallales bacterium]
MNKQTVETHNEQETADFAARLSMELGGGTVLALHGDLGAGKTVFARGFARGLGITEPVSSPTYTIIQEYKLPQDKWFYHMDLYRIDDYRSALAFGVEEYLEDSNAYILLEWPLRIKELLPTSTRHIYIEHLSENSRRIIVE